ncbi:Uncharacterised protein [Mycobacteroides abscessus subsp. abscessus]|nr:Uncharacterised protein [Mycobacteroides abscessus subsp. abscessus]
MATTHRRAILARPRRSRPSKSRTTASVSTATAAATASVRAVNATPSACACRESAVRHSSAAATSTPLPTQAHHQIRTARSARGSPVAVASSAR